MLDDRDEDAPYDVEMLMRQAGSRGMRRSLLATDTSGRATPAPDSHPQSHKRSFLYCIIVVLAASTAAFCIASVIFARRYQSAADDRDMYQSELNALTSTPAGVFTVYFLHLNDVYELNTIAGYGGLARVSTIRQGLKAKSPYVFTTLGGDLVSPSPLSTAVVNGTALKRKQMIAAMNALPLDAACYGNHEFDLNKVADLQQRMTETKFTYGWICTNCFNYNYPNLARSALIETGPNNAFKIGIIGLTLDNNNQVSQGTYNLSYSEQLALTEAANLTNRGANMIIGLTHLPIESDGQVVSNHKSLFNLVLGGHDHINYEVKRGWPPTSIFKSDSNADSVWVHAIRVDSNRNPPVWNISSELILMDSSIPDEPNVKAVVDYWLQQAQAAFAQSGLNITENIARITTDLDGLQTSVRSHSTALTDLVCQSMFLGLRNITSASFPAPQLALLNGGSVKIDDVIHGDTVLNVYDALRVLPFANELVVFNCTGSLLRDNLNLAWSCQGCGQFLQFYPYVTRNGSVSESDPNPWLIQGVTLDPTATYTVVSVMFLVTAGTNTVPLTFNQHLGNGVTVLAHGYDARFAFIDQLRISYPLT